ncbi:MAG: Chromate resistance protein ChrB [Streptosporangiaceae bacterium]
MNGEAGPAPGCPARVSWLILAYRPPARPGLKAARRFRDCDLREKDAALTGLSGRHDTIRARDTLGAANAEAALSSLAKCREALDDLARRVDQDLVKHRRAMMRGSRMKLRRAQRPNRQLSNPLQTDASHYTPATVPAAAGR